MGLPLEGVVEILKPVQIDVNGGWSAWSTWTGACSADCVALRRALENNAGSEVIPRLRRIRTCNNPAPLNGGAYCSGEEEVTSVPEVAPCLRLNGCFQEFRSCNLTCRLDGRWSLWSDWSPCSPTCHRFRTRTCTSPPPINGGRPCVGRELETVPCSDDYCIPSSAPQPRLTNDAAVYAGLACVLVLLAIIMALCTALLCKRNRGKKGSVKNIYYAENGAHVRRVLLEQQQKALLADECIKPPPIGSQFFTLGSTCSPSPMHPSMTLRSGKSAYSGYSANRNAGTLVESALSSVVVLGECEGEPTTPARLLLKPLILSIRHCASVFPRDNWSLLYADEGFGWQRVLTVGEENLNSTMYVHMEKPGRADGGMGWCHVMLDSFARVMLAGRPRRASATACKRVHLAAYGPSERPRTSSFELRVYCVPETGAAMESVAKQEQHGRLLAESEHFLLNEKGDLCFCVEDVSEGFSTRGSALVEIPDTHHQWCSQNGLHCSITVCSDMKRPADNFMARIVVYQKTNNAERHVLQVRFENSIYDKPPAEEDRVVTTDFNLPVEVKDELSQLLDPPTDPDRDWRGLAKKLHTDRYIQYFATRPGCSPTTLLLDLWEARECGSLRAAHDLLQTLRVMGRPDAVALLEQYLSHFSYVT
ncbi:death domain protein [Ostertagia ostertagi]